MSFDGIRVDHAALSQASQDLVAAAKNIESRLDTLEADLTPLQAGWSGAAKDAYHQAKTQWDKAIEEMTLLLQQVGGAVQQSNDEYRAADLRGAGRF